LSTYLPKTKNLCKLSFIDPACGSGAFVTGALGRLLDHLKHPLPCHEAINKHNLPEWKRSELILNTVTKNLHAVDLHPFAAFLTTLNVLFLLLPHYVKAREKNQDFTLNLQIFSADSLEIPDVELSLLDQLTRLNSRVQLTEESYHRYQLMIDTRFDRVFGNPPWGGVLKGPLAPIYDTAKKTRLGRSLPASTQGKYDIYGLFMERALHILKPGGRFGLLTQGTFIDKEWARGLRTLLANKTCLNYIVDLNPFGNLFFHAMNTPCVTIAVNAIAEKGNTYTVLSGHPSDFKGTSEDERRKRVVSIVLKALSKISGEHEKATYNFAQSALISYKQLRETARTRWNLAGPGKDIEISEGWFNTLDLLEAPQGVTIGGKGCLEIMLMSNEEAKKQSIESTLIHAVIKGLDITRWFTAEKGKVILYPYELTDQGGNPAFTINLSEVKDAEIRESLRREGIKDVLDFDRQIDDREREIVRLHGINNVTIVDLLKHRNSLGLVKYPNTAFYLVRYYELLEGRIFEHKNIRNCGKRWYEYHRPRNPEFILAKPKILTPRLPKKLRFSLDLNGIVPQDSCICLVPTSKTLTKWNSLQKQLSLQIGSKISKEIVLKYCLAFLNSQYAQERLTTGHRPTPKGSYAVTEEFLREIPIPQPKNPQKIRRLLHIVNKLMRERKTSEKGILEIELTKLTRDLMKT
jgi:hypothetical protein